jgi:zinc protease
MKKLIVVALSLCAAAGLALRAQDQSGLPGLSRFKLANGLEVYAYRDAAVPLVRIQVVFKAGAIAQGPEDAGLFRLYERMIFRGSPAHPGSAGVKAALASLGASEWDGGTGAERVDYWISIPSSELRQGLSFWADTLVSPSLDSEALVSEKDAAVREIEARAADPDSVYQAALDKRLFAKYPWRRDPAGSEKAVRAATVESLKALAAKWFVPNNAAVFVGGDVDPEEVRLDAEAAFGAWKAGSDPWAKSLPQNPKPGVARPTWIVYPDPSLPEGIGTIEARYRGPDLGADSASSYAADLWTSLVSPPDGRFKAGLEANVPKLGGREGISAAYVSQRDGGYISISSYFNVDPALPAVDRARSFKERARGFEITSMKTDPSYFSAADYEAARKRLLDDRAMAADGAEGMIEALAFWWAAASVDYFIGYPAALAKTGPREVTAFLDAYVMRNLEVVALRMNSADYEREKATFASSGFETVSASDAFWWQK